MRNRFKLNEEEKRNIKRLQGISEQGLMGNIFNTRDDGHTIGKNSIIRILKEIKQLQEEDSPAIAQRRLEELFEKVGLTSGVDIEDVEVEPQPEAEEEVEDEAGMRYMHGDRDAAAIAAYEKGNES